MEPLLNSCKDVLEYSLLVEIKLLQDNKWDINQWLTYEEKSYDTNIKLSSKDFNNKLRLFSILANFSKKEAMTYLKTKVKDLYN